MTKFGFLGAAAIVACAMASPAMAQQVSPTHGRCLHSNPNCTAMGLRHGSQYQHRDRHADRDWNGRNDRNFGWNEDRRHDSGFWPADVAAGVVGGAIGTGVAIATDPFRANSYAWDNGGRNGWSESYMKRNGFVCVPGTWFRGQDGRQHICQ